MLQMEDANDIAEMESKQQAVEEDPNEMEDSEEEKAQNFKNKVNELAAEAETKAAAVKAKNEAKKAAEKQAEADAVAKEKAAVAEGQEFQRNKALGIPVAEPKLTVVGKTATDAEMTLKYDDEKREAVQAKEAEIA